MKLFEKFMSQKSADVVTTMSEPQAWINILVACAGVNDDVSDSESETICKVLVFKSIFKGLEVMELYRNSYIKRMEIKSKPLIDQSISFVSKGNRPTLYALCIEVLVADGILEEDEANILDYLATALELDQTLAEKIVEVMLIKLKGSIIINE